MYYLINDWSSYVRVRVSWWGGKQICHLLKYSIYANDDVCTAVVCTAWQDAGEWNSIAVGFYGQYWRHEKSQIANDQTST